jgi:hypothetical protein
LTSAKEIFISLEFVSKWQKFVTKNKEDYKAESPFSMAQNWNFYIVCMYAKTKCTSNVQERHLQIAIIHWTLTSPTITMKTNSHHQIQESHWPEKKIFKPIHNPIQLNIKNDGLFWSFPLDFYKILTNLADPSTHLTISSFKTTKKKFSQPNPTISLTITFFSSHLDTSLFNSLYISTLVL